MKNLAPAHPSGNPTRERAYLAGIAPHRKTPDMWARLVAAYFQARGMMPTWERVQSMGFLDKVPPARHFEYVRALELAYGGRFRTGPTARAHRAFERLLGRPLSDWTTRARSVTPTRRRANGPRRRVRRVAAAVRARDGDAPSDPPSSRHSAPGQPVGGAS